MAGSLITQILWIVAELLLQVSAVIFLPAAVIKFFYKDLDFLTSMVASLWIIFIPMVLALNTLWNVDSLYASFAGWGVSQVKTYNWMTWALTSGAIVSCVYAALLVCCVRRKQIGNTIIGFFWLSLILNITNLILLPRILFGTFGWQFARDSQTVLFVIFVLTVASSIYIYFSRSCKNLFYA